MFEVKICDGCNITIDSDVITMDADAFTDQAIFFAVKKQKTLSAIRKTLKRLQNGRTITYQL